MWLLIVMMFSTLPPGLNDPRGSITVRVAAQEECLQMKERIEKTMRFDKHRMSASCVFKGN